MYTTDITFNRKKYTITIHPKGQKYDLVIETKGRLSGDEYQKIKHYLETEGYVEAARSWFENSII